VIIIHLSEQDDDQQRISPTAERNQGSVAENFGQKSPAADYVLSHACPVVGRAGKLTGR